MTALNDVNLEEAKVTAYSATEAGLAKMRADFDPAKLPEKVTDENYPLVKEAATTLQKLRTGLDKKRKEVKAPYKEACDLIDSEARRITAAITEIEEPWKEAKAEYDQREKRRKEELARKIEAVFTRIEGYVEQAYTASGSAEVASIIDECRNEDCTDAYARAKEALELRNRTIERLQEIYGQRVDAEVEAKRRQQLEAEQRKMRAEAAAKEHIASMKGAVADLMEADKDTLETELSILEDLYLDEDDYGDLFTEAEVARRKAIAGIKKLILMAPDPEPESIAVDLAAPNARDYTTSANIALTPKEELDVVVQLQMPESRMSAVMSLLMDQFAVEQEAQYRFKVK